MNHCKTLTLILFLSSMLAWTANAQRIDLNLKDVTVKEAMETLKNRSGYSFVYEAGDIDARAKVSVKATRIEDAISQIVAGQNVSYELRGKNIVLQKTARGQQKVKRTITGIVKDANGLSVIGATILEKGNRTNGVVTDSQGRFTITVSEGSPLIVNCIGYKQIEMNPGVRDNLDIVLEDDMQLLDEVVVVGYDTQKKVNLSGSVSCIVRPVQQPSGSPELHGTSGRCAWRDGHHRWRCSWLGQRYNPYPRYRYFRRLKRFSARFDRRSAGRSELLGCGPH